jgi:ABC-type sugar transport system permease subunit
MATARTRATARLMTAPAVLLLLAWMLIPLGMTLYFSTLRYNLLMPGMEVFVGWENYEYFVTDPAFWTAMRNTLVMVGSSSSSRWAAASCSRSCSTSRSGDRGSCGSSSSRPSS